MSDNVQLPALGESVTEGTVTRWLKNVGDTVAVDEPLVEISTDKVDTEIPSPFAGVLEQILVQEDETVGVGVALAVIGSGEGAAGGSTENESAPAEERQAEQAPAEEEPAAPEAEQAELTPQAPPVAEQVFGARADGAPVTMPALGESVTEGTVTRWLKNVGDTVALDEPLLEISTDKVDTEIPSPFAGTLQQILIQEDETVEVGTLLAVISAGAGAVSSAATPTAVQPQAPAQAPAPAPASRPDSAPIVAPVVGQPDSAVPLVAPGGPPTASGSYLTPLVRKLAAEKHVDLTSVTGTGVGGRIRKEDVLEAAAKAAPVAISPLRGTTEKISPLRKLVANRLVESLQTSAQLTTIVEVDVTKVARLRARAKTDFKAREGVNLTFLPFFALAAVEALKTYPKINASIDGDTIVYHGSENLGIAVDTERGLVVPVVKDAGDLNLAGIARKIADLAARTRVNKVGPDDLTGGTFTITNTGSGGALIDTPIVALPQVAILGTGAIVKRPVIATDADGSDIIAIRSMIYLSLSYDHRLVDGADAARYLAAVKNRIEEGAFESEVGL